MSDYKTERIAAGKGIMKDNLAKIMDSAKVFLGALKGFRRDLLLSESSCPECIHTDFPEQVNSIAVPPLSSGMSFPDLEGMLKFCEAGMSGKIAFRSISRAEQDSAGEKILAEVDLIHKNLIDVSETAYHLYECIKAAGLDFDMFNSQNIDEKNPEADILFNRDAMNVSMGLSRALSERAVRFDIDLVESRKQFES